MTDLFGKEERRVLGRPSPLFTVCVTKRYMYLDLSLLFNCEPGIEEVATIVQDGKIFCLFNWKYPNTENHFDKIIELPYQDWWGELFAKGVKHNEDYIKSLKKNQS